MKDSPTMFRTLAIASAASLLAIMTGCSGAPASTTDSTDNALSGKSSGYFVGKGLGVTGGISVALANAKTTACPTGDAQGACAVLGVDFGRLGLDADAAAQLSDDFSAGHVVVQGRLDAKTTTLVADGAWLGAVSADAQAYDALYLVNLEVLNRMCLAGTPCSGPRYRQVAVNETSTTSTLEINDVALDGVGSTDDAAQAQDEMKIGGEGLLVLGHDVALVSNHDAQTTRTLLVTDFFLPVDVQVADAMSAMHRKPGLTCASVDCAQGYRCEMKGINGGAIPVCVKDSSTLTCASVDCAQGMHCEMKGINGGAIPVCIADAAN